MKNSLPRLWEFIVSLTHSRTLSLLAFLVILAAIPLTVFIAQQQQEIRQRAEESSCPEQCYSTELWVGIPRLADGTCDDSHPSAVFKCPGEENTITCNNQPWYCDGYWKPGVRPQPTQPPTLPTAAPTNPPLPTAIPTRAGPAAALQTCTAEGYRGFCANASGQFPPPQQLSCGAQGFTRASGGDSACTNRNYPECYICLLSALPQPTATRPPAAVPTATPTLPPAPPAGGPTATPTTTPSAILGDINADGKVDITDYSILTSCFGSNMDKPVCGTNKTKADLNKDGKVDGIDYNILIRNFGE
ncbi:MAG: hypothetical protein HYZ02_00170 [Candidatus Levybacteria bacterium]|nr:hypothetical protein [Candidatus Levybacteria bacterium]